MLINFDIDRFDALLFMECKNGEIDNYCLNVDDKRFSKVTNDLTDLSTSDRLDTWKCVIIKFIN